MCRNIRTLFNFDPPATDDEIRAAALQFVRKLSGFTRPSKSNEAAFDRAVTDVAHVARDLLDALVTQAPSRNREVEAAKARARTRGHMSVGVIDDRLMVRVGADAYEKALSRKHVRPMDFTGKPLTGFVYVEPAGIRTRTQLSSWIGKGLELAASLPVKKNKKKR